MDQIFTLLLTYKYAILFPLAIIEGPIISVIAGFLVALGLLNAVFVYGIVVLGDLVGDTLVYSLGYWGVRIIHTYGPRFGVTAERLEYAKGYFNEHQQKAVALSKLVHGIGVTGLIAAGSLHVPYRRYIKICFLVTLFQAAAFLTVGILFGHAYAQISKYLDYVAATASIVVLAVAAGIVWYKIRAS